MSAVNTTNEGFDGIVSDRTIARVLHELPKADEDFATMYENADGPGPSRWGTPNIGQPMRTYRPAVVLAALGLVDNDAIQTMAERYVRLCEDEFFGEWQALVSDDLYAGGEPRTVWEVRSTWTTDWITACGFAILFAFGLGRTDLARKLARFPGVDLPCPEATTRRFKKPDVYWYLAMCRRMRHGQAIRDNVISGSETDNPGWLTAIKKGKTRAALWLKLMQTINTTRKVEPVLEQIELAGQHFLEHEWAGVERVNPEQCVMLEVSLLWFYAEWFGVAPAPEQISERVRSHMLIGDFLGVATSRRNPS